MSVTTNNRRARLMPCADTTKTASSCASTLTSLPISASMVSSNWHTFVKQKMANEVPISKQKSVSQQKLADEPRDSSQSVACTRCHVLWFDDERLWFDGVDANLIDPEDRLCARCRKQSATDNCTTAALTHCVALDCEMVGVGPGGRENALARVSLVNARGQCLYDQFVRPREPVTDYRTSVSGVTRAKLRQHGIEFTQAQREVSRLLAGRVLVGHSVHHDLSVLLLTHPRHMTRDTSTYGPFRAAVCAGRRGCPSLRRLCEHFLAVRIQTGVHDSVEDARATMRLYQLYRREWEAAVTSKRRV